MHKKVQNFLLVKLVFFCLLDLKMQLFAISESCIFIISFYLHALQIYSSSFEVKFFDLYKDASKYHDVETISLDVEAKNASQFDQKQFYT